MIRMPIDIQKWPFNDAPRHLRLQAVDKIPELLESLLKTAADMSDKMTQKADEIIAITDAISSVVESASKAKGQTIQELIAGAVSNPVVPKVRK